MKKSTLEEMKNLLKSGDMCVLCTCGEGKPHCSLMAYVTDHSATTVFMVTLKDTQKYRNLLESPQASLLVDTRNDLNSEDRGKVRALTVSGTFHPITDPAERLRILNRLAGTHVHLKGLIDNKDAEPFAVKVDSFLLLAGALEAKYLEV